MVELNRPFNGEPLHYSDSVRTFCGGALIRLDVVVTAAHCFIFEAPGNVILYLNDTSRTTIVANATDFRKNPNEVVVRAVKTIVLHPLWQKTDVAFQHDIALVKLKTPFIEIDSYVYSIGLIPRGTDLETAITNKMYQKNLISAGWGILYPSNELIQNTDPSSVLQMLSLPFVPKATCSNTTAEYIKKHSQTRNIKVTSDMICAGGKQNEDTCTGDSGGPLAAVDVMFNRVLVGVVSFGFTCGKSVPAMYTSIYHHLDFIEDTLKSF